MVMIRVTSDRGSDRLASGFNYNAACKTLLLLLYGHEPNLRMTHVELHHVSPTQVILTGLGEVASGTGVLPELFTVEINYDSI